VGRHVVIAFIVMAVAVIPLPLSQGIHPDLRRDTPHPSRQVLQYAGIGVFIDR
jgi:hypothetical protein